MNSRLRNGDPRPFLTYRDVAAEQQYEILALARKIASSPGVYHGALDGHRVGLLFHVPSTRTRTSFWRAGTDLGAELISFAPGELQLSTGESWADTGMVLSEYLDSVVVRNDGPLEEIRALSRYLRSTINALSREEHPTQAIADYCALAEHFGEVEGLRLAYFGEGNNTAAALALLMARVDGVRCDFYCPPGFGLPEEVVAFANADAADEPRLRLFDTVPAAPDPVDAVYTTRWESMGKTRDLPGWREVFAPFRISGELFARFAELDRTVFMHDLPAIRNDEVASSVLDGPCSIVRSQARHKLTAATAVLLWSAGYTTV